MFERWHDFYILVGSAAGALIGLLFVVMTLTSSMDRDQALKGASRYMTPTLVQFTTALLVSAIACAPLEARWQRGLLGVLAVVLLAWALVNAWRMFLRPLDGQAHWTDPWFYAAAPAVAYLALGAVAGAGSAVGIGVLAMAILILGVRNAWDLITWIAPGRPPTPPPG